MAIKTCSTKVQGSQETTNNWDVIQDKKKAPWSNARKGDDRVVINTGENQAYLTVKKRSVSAGSSGLFVPTELMLGMGKTNPNSNGAERKNEILRGNRYQVLGQDTNGDGVYDKIRVQSGKKAIDFTLNNDVEKSDGVFSYAFTPACDAERE